MNKNSKVLIIGGGFAGARVAQELVNAGFQHVTLVDKKDYFEVTYASMRAIVQPEIGVQSRVTYTDFIKGDFVQGIVQELTPNNALLTDGKTLAFDFAVVASGSSYATFPIGKSEDAMDLNARADEVKRAHEQLETASNVLIIGGGIVGVELAGEVAAYSQNKSVTLAHAADRLLKELKPKASRIADEKLKNLGVTILYNKRISESDDEYKNADLVYTCIGLKPNTAIMQKHFASQLDAQGRIKVDQYFRVENSENVFALGDCANMPEGKLGYLADQQAAALAKNMIAMVNGKVTKAYKLNPMMALVPVGPKKGLVQLPFGVTTLGFLVNMKQKDMFISKTYKTLDVKNK